MIDTDICTYAFTHTYRDNTEKEREEEKDRQKEKDIKKEREGKGRKRGREGERRKNGRKEINPLLPNAVKILGGNMSNSPIILVSYYSSG